MMRLLFITLAVLFTHAASAATPGEQHASFDHSKLAPSAQCIRCHRRDQPDDNLHRKSQANCSSCHSVTKWKPVLSRP